MFVLGVNGLYVHEVHIRLHIWLTGYGFSCTPEGRKAIVFRSQTCRKILWGYELCEQQAFTNQVNVSKLVPLIQRNWALSFELRSVYKPQSTEKAHTYAH